ncbi:excisionase family DNA-binding protein [Tsukamurella tyrosinosolvens]|uniref:excisionase family DNA-binding protein n=1 Tax=Tsukamurella tyrosinosolvens TaxID=57704 RepID=UPI00398C1BA4
MSIQAAANKLQVHYITIRRMIERAELDVWRPSRGVTRVRRSQVEAPMPPAA